jgi:hypothetical protein
MAMNLREGTRRLALLLGVVGAILGGFASYAELQSVLEQRARHNRFEQLAALDVVQQERKELQAEPNDWQKVPDDKWAKYAVKSDDTPQIDAKTGERVANPQTAEHGPWEKYPEKSTAHKYYITDEDGTVLTSQVWVGEVKTINWTMGKAYAVKSIETVDGQTLYPTPAPSAWMYLLVALFPILGFFIPWGAIRAIGWVGAGFVARPK